MPASHTFYDNLKLDETGYALATTPGSHVEQANDIGENMGLDRRRSGLDRRRQAQGSRRTVLDNHDLTETLTIGWAIALAIAVALAVYVSGG